MQQFLNNLSYFIYGVIFGFFAHPVYVIIKKIIAEVINAKNEWRKPPER